MGAGGDVGVGVAVGNGVYVGISVTVGTGVKVGYGVYVGSGVEVGTAVSDVQAMTMAIMSKLTTIRASKVDIGGTPCNVGWTNRHSQPSPVIGRYRGHNGPTRKSNYLFHELSRLAMAMRSVP